MADLTAEQVQAELMGHADAALNAKQDARAAAEKGDEGKGAAVKVEAEGKGDDAGAGKGKGDEGAKGGEPVYKNPSDAKNFRALREIAESMKATAQAAQERADRLEKELRDLRTPAQKDPLEEAISKMDPEERKRLEATGVMPLLLAGLDARKEAKDLKAKVGELASDKEAREGLQQAHDTLIAATAEYGKENEDLKDDDLLELIDIIGEGKVAGRTHRDLLDNAREVMDLRRKAAASEGGKGKDEGTEADLARRARKAAAGGADGSAGTAAPPRTASRKEMVEKYQEIKANDPAEADRILITAMTRPGDLRKMPAGLLPAKTK